MDVPADLVQSMYFTNSFRVFRAKLNYFLKAQIVPVNTDMINNGWGKCKVRDRQRIHISPVRPIVSDPQYNIPIQFEKSVGYGGEKKCNVRITMSKNFFLAGEMAYFMVDVDNSQCTDPCSLIISHKCKMWMQNYWRKYTLVENHTKERFFIAGPGEHKQVVLKF